MDRLRAFAVFKSVVDNGSFTKAADAMAMAPSAVTRTLQDLEALLGVRLLQRTTRRVVLTTVGQEVLERAGRLLDSYDELAIISSLSSTEPAGIVRVLAPVSLGPHYLGPTMSSFMRQYPKVFIDLRLRDAALDLLSNDFDIALCLSRDLRPSLVARHVAQVAVGLYAAPIYLAGHVTPTTPGELPPQDCLTCEELMGGQTWQFQSAASELRCAVQAQGMLNTNHVDALMSIALHGAGIALLPDFVVEHAVTDGRLCRVLGDWRLQSLSIHLAYPSRRNQPLRVRRLIEHLIQTLAATSDAAADSLRNVPCPRDTAHPVHERPALAAA